MPRVSGHYRADGTYVRPHYRRSTPRAAHGTGQQWVRTHYRNGRRVTGHWRNVAEPQPTRTDDSSLYLFGIPIGVLFLILFLVLVVTAD